MKPPGCYATGIRSVLQLSVEAWEVSRDGTKDKQFDWSEEGFPAARDDKRTSTSAVFTFKPYQDSG